MLPPSLKNLINHFSRLPGIGQRAATRLSFYLLSRPAEELESFAQTLKDLKTKTKVCPNCFNLTSDNLCAICADKKRDANLICVIEDILDIIPIERTRQFNGLYHVLGGLISPTDGLTPDKLKIKELINRIKRAKTPPEIILAFNPTIEGDATALYLERILKPFNIKITRLARGLSTGNDLEYADESTLINAIKFRK